MQEQNFEKQVHSLMDDLVVPPSPSVWNKVEEQIRRKKDRRRIVFWLFPFLLIGSGLVWWIISSENYEIEKNNEPATSISTLKNNHPTDEIVKPDTQQKISASRDKLNTNNIESSVAKKQYSSSNRQFNYNISRKTNTQHTENSVVINDDNLLVPESQKTPSPVDKKIEKTSIVSNEPNIVNAPDSTVEENVEKIQEVEIIMPDSSEIKQSDAEGKTDEVVQETEQSKPSAVGSKWKLSPYLAFGISNVTKGLFDPVVSADFSASPGVPAGSGSPAIRPSVPENGPSFSAGIRIIKSLNKRLEFATGLQYSFFSTRQNIGNQVVNDTVITYSNLTLRLQNYYQNGNANKYANHYHFISIPALIEYQVLKNVPVSIQAGVSINRLLSTNALLFNSSSNIQFENDNAWNKTQLHASSGLQYHFFKGKTFSFKAGPYLQYSFSRLEKDLNKKKFLSVAGVQTQFYFQNKK